MIQLMFILASVLGLASIMFALQNNVPVTVTFLLWRFDSSLAMVLLLAFALGGVAIALATTPATLRRQWAASRQTKRIHELEQAERRLTAEIAELRARAPMDVPAPVDAPPYVGLKQLIAGRDQETPGSGTPPG